MDCISLFEYLWLQSRAKVPFKSSVDNKVPIITIFKLRSVTVVSSNIFWIKFLAGMEMMQNKERSKVLVLHCPFIMPAKTFESLIVLPPYSASYQMLWTLNWADGNGKGSVTKSFASTLSTDVPLNFQSYPRQKLTGGFAYFLRIRFKLQQHFSTYFTLILLPLPPFDWWTEVHNTITIVMVWNFESGDFDSWALCACVPAA